MLNLLHTYHSAINPNPRVLELCGIAGPDVAYTAGRDEDLTAIINSYGRPEYVPLVWEALQYQTRRSARNVDRPEWVGRALSSPSRFS